MSLDMSRYLTLFVGEATEHLEALSLIGKRIRRTSTAFYATGAWMPRHHGRPLPRAIERIGKRSAVPYSRSA